MNLVEFPCPDCTKPKFLPLIDAVAKMLKGQKCPTCNDHRKVLVKREDLIKLGDLND